MILDFEEFEDGSELATDLCIIGSGAAGIALAGEFLNSPLRVTIVEGGGRTLEARSQALYQSDVIRLPHTGIHEGRARTFGGATTTWGGQLLPLSPADFEAKPWAPHSGWPFGIDTLAPFYRRATELMGVPGEPFDEARWNSFPVTPPPLDPAQFHYRFSQWASLSHRNFALAFGNRLKDSRNVDVLLHANAVEIVPNREANRIDHLRLKSYSARGGRIKARYYVVCCGGIESARLLLASNSVVPRGVGNANDLVGRYFQDHVSLRAGRFVATDRRRLQALFDPFYIGGAMLTLKIQMTHELQRSLEILNVLGHVAFEMPADSGLLEAKKIVAALQAGTNPLPSARGSWRMLRDAKDFARVALGRAIFRRRRSPGRGDILLLVDSEQAPNPDSRIRLSERRDALGMPRAELDWRLTELDTRTLRAFASRFQAEWARHGLGAIELFDEAPTIDGLWQPNMRDTFHHMGATRMSESPRAGVVDAQCMVHGVNNLYVASSSVFPTSGNSNPTLTILALCLRLADHLKMRLKD